MKYVLRLEEAAMFAFSVYFLSILHVAWWVYLMLLLAPDISMLGYLAGPAIGAVSYDFFHHKAVAIVLFVISAVFNIFYLEVASLVLFGHSSLDRMLGYGLKLKQGFQYTHLGMIGNGNRKDK